MSSILKLFPWTNLFGTRSNFEGGYFTKEAELVDKYLKNVDNVLVFGSGNGREARPIIDRAKRIICFDFGLGYLLAGKKLCESEGIKNVSFILADALHLPFPSDSFDFIFFSIYSSLKNDRFKVITDIHRILRKNGLVLICVYMPSYPKAKKYGSITFKSIGHLEKEVNEYGFSLVEGGQDQKRPHYIFSILAPRLK
jgi:ubiquinone/menaquinone biosynthesis C-methylase UbiE